MQNNYNKVDTYEVVPAGFFARLAAFIIDSLIVGVVIVGIKVPVWCVSLFFTDAFWNQGILFQFTIVDIIIYLLSVTYFILFTYCAGATLGKKVMNIEVVSTQERELTKLQVVYRETVGRYLSMVVCYLGYLLVFVDKEKRSLHDVLADTKVVYGKRIKVSTYYKGKALAESEGVQDFAATVVETGGVAEAGGVVETCGVVGIGGVAEASGVVETCGVVGIGGVAEASGGSSDEFRGDTE